MEKWSAEEANYLRDGALALLSQHDCGGSRRVVDRENCGACVLNGYHADDEDGPNYSGWARVYAQAHKRVPIRWRYAFKLELKSDNKAYAEALQRDILTFGDPRGHA